MYLLPAGFQSRSKTKWGGLGILPAMMDRSDYSAPMSNMIRYIPPGSSLIPRPPTTTVPRPPIVPVIEKPSPITAPIVRAPIPVAPKPVLPIVRPPISILPYPVPKPVMPVLPYRPPTPAPPVTPAVNTGTPVPTNFPTNQFYVANDGSVWEFGSGKWFNTGTPYSAPGASSPAPSPAPTPAPVSSTPVVTSSGGGTTSSPVNVAVTSDSGYQTILDWLPQRTLIGSVPNWAVVAGVGFLGWKIFSGKGGR